MEYYSSYMELSKEITILKKTFQIVRILEPSRKKELLIDSETFEVTEIAYNCLRENFSQKKCDFCLAKYVYNKKVEYTKYDVYGDQIYLITAKYICLLGEPCVMELIKIINHTHFLGKKGENEFLYRMKKLEKSIYEDELTGVYNRRFVNETLPGILLEARSTKENIGICMIDVDYFKTINDGYGHLIGDQVLRKVAEIFYKNIEPSEGDFIARYGGDEFILVLRAYSAQRNLERLQKVEKAIQCLKIYREEKAIPFSISIGYSHIEELESKPTVEKLIELADRRLYQAKSDGRNRIVIK